MESINLSLVEIIMMVLVAITLGITIHFFITSRRSFSAQTKGASAKEKTSKELETWKLKYFNDIEARDKELEQLRNRLADVEENNHINEIEADEMRKQNKKLKAEIELLQNTAVAAQPATNDKTDYIDQLRLAQSSLLEHNEKINQLLGQIDIVKETEEKQQEILKYNQELSGQIDELKFLVSQKEKEINNIEQKANLTKEMTSMLDNAYTEFDVLQDKIQKLETQLAASKNTSIEYEDLKETHYKLSHDFDEQKIKYNAAKTQNQELQQKLNETEDELREASFQRQQLQKKVAYLEELNRDLHAVADTNKKLEGQLKRLGELESMLNIVAEEKDELAKKQFKSP